MNTPLSYSANLHGDMANKRVALYARVSTLLAQSPEMQLLELREYASRRGWIVVGEYVDRASGAKESRPALNRLMLDACRRKFDLIAVWKIDRFGRSLRHLVNALAELEEVGVAFVSLRDNVDLSTASGRLMFQIVAAMAEFEPALIQERVRAGLRNARAQGKRLGRPRIVVDVAKISPLRAQGHSWASIGGELGIGEGTARRAAVASAKNLLENPVQILYLQWEIERISARQNQMFLAHSFQNSRSSRRSGASRSH